MKEKLKKTGKKIPSILGFVTMYVIPILLFGNIIPYTRQDIPAGLTRAGYFAVALIALIIIGKFKQRIYSKPKSIYRGLTLSIFPIIFWVIVKIGVDYIERAIITFSNYWDKVIIFILIGRMLYCLGEALNAESEK